MAQACHGYLCMWWSKGNFWEVSFNHMCSKFADWWASMFTCRTICLTGLTPASEVCISVPEYCFHEVWKFVWYICLLQYTLGSLLAETTVCCSESLWCHTLETEPPIVWLHLALPLLPFSGFFTFSPLSTLAKTLSSLPATCDRSSWVGSFKWLRFLPLAPWDPSW